MNCTETKELLEKLNKEAQETITQRKVFYDSKSMDWQTNTAGWKHNRRTVYIEKYLKQLENALKDYQGFI